MQVEIQKWGNSAAVRLPALVLTIENGKLIFTPKREYKLEELLAAITPENCHPLLLDDSLKGNESW